MVVKEIVTAAIEVSKEADEVRLDPSPMEKNRVYEIRLNDSQSVTGDTLLNNLICSPINELH